MVQGREDRESEHSWDRVYIIECDSVESGEGVQYGGVSRESEEVHIGSIGSDAGPGEGFGAHGPWVCDR